MARCRNSGKELVWYVTARPVTGSTERVRCAACGRELYAVRRVPHRGHVERVFVPGHNAVAVQP